MLLSAQMKLKGNGGQALSLLLSISLTALTGLAQGGPEPPAEAERKVELVSSAETPAQPERRRILERRVRRPWGLRIVDVLKFPLNQFGKALDAGALKVEKDHALERAQDLQAAALAKGYEPLFGGLGTGSGFAFGVNIARKNFLGTGWQLDVPIEYSTNLYAGLGVYLTVPIVPNNKVSVRTGFHYYDRPEEDFFGFGARSAEADRSNFRLEKRLFTLALETRPWNNLVLGFPVSLSNSGISEGKDNRFPGLQQQFDTSQIPGVTGANLVSWGMFLDWDYRDDVALPSTGGRLHVEAGYFQDTGQQDFRFTRYNLEAVQYLPLDDGHVVVIRLLGLVNDEKGNTQIPLSEKTILGGRETMRGFREFRFRDDNAILFNFEYRWRIWRFADLILFFDEGQVAAEPGDFSLSELRSSRGIGLRFRGRESQIFRFDAGHSAEGWRYYMSFELVF